MAAAQYGVAGSRLGVCSLHATSHPTDKCGINGLPLTPNSISILGRAQRLFTLRHPNLCEYIAAHRGSNERVFLVSEHFDTCLSARRRQGALSHAEIAGLGRQLVHATAYLHRHGIVHRNLSPDNILLDAKGNVKLTQYALYDVCFYGATVSFPIGVPGYLAPEVVAAKPNPTEQSNPKSDTWSIGIVLLEAYLGHPLWEDVRAEGACDLMRIFQRTLAAVQLRSECGGDATEYLSLFASAASDTDAIANMPKVLLELLWELLAPLPGDRPLLDDILSHPLWEEALADAESNAGVVVPWLRCASLANAQRAPDLSTEAEFESQRIRADPLLTRELRVVYQLWTLTGGDVEADLIKRGFIKRKAPIDGLTRLVRVGKPELKEPRDRTFMLHPAIIPLDLQPLSRRLCAAKLDLFPLVLPLDGGSARKRTHLDAETLPLRIREQDIDYQFCRLNIMGRLMAGCPYTRPHVINEAVVDIPPLYRAQIWATLLDVPPNIDEEFEATDKYSEHPTDRQIEVDIPRCHQYDPLLSSATGHGKFRRVLKAWVTTNTDLVYWQGLDSLCAPFVKLHFNNEATAFGCLRNFVDRFLTGFFLKDNSRVMQEFLAVFSHLVAYHDPELAWHLHEIGFIPELYAIPWFLTCFAHVFPLEKIFHLWDSLLLGNSSMTLCIGASILMQQRDILLSFDFNECILLYSDAPDVDIEKSVDAGRRLFEQTPQSLTLRQFSMHPSDPKQEGFEIPNLAVRRGSLAPVMSLEDFLHLYKPKGKRRRRSQVVVVDVRSAQDFASGHLPANVLSIPHDEGFDTDGVCRPEFRQFLRPMVGKHVVVVASKGKTGPRCAENLVKSGVPKVSLLSGGASALRVKGLLTSTS